MITEEISIRINPVSCSQRGRLEIYTSVQYCASARAGISKLILPHGLLRIMHDACGHCGITSSYMHPAADQKQNLSKDLLLLPSTQRPHDAGPILSMHQFLEVAAPILGPPRWWQHKCVVAEGNQTVHCKTYALINRTFWLILSRHKAAPLSPCRHSNGIVPHLAPDITAAAFLHCRQENYCSVLTFTQGQDMLAKRPAPAQEDTAEIRTTQEDPNPSCPFHIEKARLHEPLLW